MKRDLTLMREILERAEAVTPSSSLTSKEFVGRDEPLVAYHMGLLEKAGYVRAIVVLSNGDDQGPLHAEVFDLTMSGHAYLARLRQQGQTLNVYR